MASPSLSKLLIIDLILALKLAQNFSIELRSGEYGGKNNNSQPTLSIRFCVLADL